MHEFDFNLFKQIVDIPAPTGRERELVKFVKEWLLDNANGVGQVDPLGNLIVDLGGNEDGPTVMFDVHTDEISLMVSYVGDNGFVRVRPVGGIDAAMLPGQRMKIVSDSGSTYTAVVSRPSLKFLSSDEEKTTQAVEEIWLDTGLSHEDPARNSIKVGCPVLFDGTAEKLDGNRLMSRALDNKLGVYMAMQLAANVSRMAPNDHARLVLSFSAQEEIGCRGASVSAMRIKPDYALVHDVTHAGDIPNFDIAKTCGIKLGRGVSISTGPNISPTIEQKLMLIAELGGIPYQREARNAICPNDTRAIQIAGEGVACGLIGVPIRYMHTPHEICDLRDVDAAIGVATEFAKCAVNLPKIRE